MKGEGRERETAEELQVEKELQDSFFCGNSDS